MKILLASVVMILIPCSSLAVQYCQEADPANLAHIETAAQIHNVRTGASYDSKQFIAATMKQAVMAEIVWQEEQEIRAEMEAEIGTQEERRAQMIERLRARHAELNSNW